MPVALRESARAAELAARAAFEHRDRSFMLSDAMLGRTPPGSVQRIPAPSPAVAAHSSLGSLQHLAGAVFLLEQSQRARETWWALLSPVVREARAATAPCVAGVGPAIATWASAIEKLGYPPRAAEALATEIFGFPHHVPVQLLARRWPGFVAELERADPAAAAECRALWRRWLRSIALEPGSLPLRLLAAEALADDLEGDEALAAIRTELRDWHAATRDRLRAQPAEVLAATAMPGVAPAEHARLLRTSGVLVSVLLNLAFYAALMTMLIWGLALPRPPGWLRLILVGVAVSAVSAVTAKAVSLMDPQQLAQDARFELSHPRYWPRVPILSLLASAAALVGYSAWEFRRRGQARAAVGAWLVLGVTLGLSAAAVLGRSMLLADAERYSSAVRNHLPGAEQKLAGGADGLPALAGWSVE